MRITKREKAFAAVGVSVLAAHYIIPYTVLKEASGFILFMFWTLIGVLWLAATLAYVRGWGK